MADQRPDFSKIPSLDRLLQAPAVIALVESHGRSATVAALRAALDTARGALAAGDAVDLVESLSLRRPFDQPIRGELAPVYGGLAEAFDAELR